MGLQAHPDPDEEGSVTLSEQVTEYDYSEQSWDLYVADYGTATIVSFDSEVPEPSSEAILCVSLIFLVGMRSRRWGMMAPALDAQARDAGSVDGV
jgi:hypothetical protein